ncbi:hypothetical protein D9619_008709 [Psilocybe cf. subviscida]|uniref:Uncharacterized protein n=1 Tax=Psilocybe cf. subviscida TaxID=2480587 RepID=A0A8H5F0J6_9AGAR|nr:hypothetical protein D9619_008709 [Psilocybe cf. subviscida]
MEAGCPHLGADISLAYRMQTSSSVMMGCRYDFNLKTGHSETGLKACTYDVQVKSDPQDWIEQVDMETPEGGTFADPSPVALKDPLPFIPTEKKEPEPVVPLTNPPTTLILNTASPTLKVCNFVSGLTGAMRQSLCAYSRR